MGLERGPRSPRLVTGIAVLVAVLAEMPGFGGEFKSGENVIVGESEVVEDDLYMTGDTMTVKGRVVGDVVAAGRMVIIEGTVQGDLIAAAQSVVIHGTVTDDVRIAGMTLQLTAESQVGDDVFAAGFSFESEPGSRIEGKTGLSGYQALLSGEHRQGLEASVVALEIAGNVDGDVDATVESTAAPAWWIRFLDSPIAMPSVDPGLSVASQARIGGDLRYQSQDEARIGSDSEVVGRVEHRTPKVEPEIRPSFAQRVGKTLSWAVVWFLLGAMFLWLVPDKLLGVTDTLASRPLASLGWGLVTLLGVPLMMLLILVLASVVTMAFGILKLGPGAALALVCGILSESILAAGLWFMVLFLGPVVVGLAAGRWLVGRLSSVERSRILCLLLGLLIYAALIVIPLAGAWLKVVAVVAGVGAGSLWSVRYLARADTP